MDETEILERTKLMDKTEMLEREKIEEIIDNLDMYKLAREAFEDARYQSLHMSGAIDVVIDLTTGELESRFNAPCFGMSTDPTPYVILFRVPFTYGGSDEYFLNDYKDMFVEEEHIAYYEELEEKSRLSQEEDGNEDDFLYDDEIKDAVIEKFNLNESELEEEFYKELDEYNFERLRDDCTIEQLDEIYDGIED